MSTMASTMASITLFLMAAFFPTVSFALQGAVQAPDFIGYPVTATTGASVFGKHSKRQADVAAIGQRSGTLYTINISLGTPGQSIPVQFDTGASELWVNPVCSKSSNPSFCNAQPRFTQSSTLVDLGVQGSVQSLGSGEYAGFEYVVDYLTIGSARITQQIFGIAYDSTEAVVGVMGAGPDLGGWDSPYPFVIDSLAQQGYINSRAFSMDLKGIDSTAGSVIFGGVDTKKYSGNLITLPIVPAAQSPDGFTRFYVRLDGISVNQADGTAVNVYAKPAGGLGQAVLLDSGYTLSALPTAIFNNLVAAFPSAVYVPNADLYTVDCLDRGQGGSLDFTFDGKVINVPYYDFVWHNPDNGLCYLGAYEDNFAVLGDTFLRAAYVVFDWDNRNIHLAQSADCGSNVVAIGSGAAAIPSGAGDCPVPQTTSSSSSSTVSSTSSWTSTSMDTTTTDPATTTTESMTTSTTESSTSSTSTESSTGTADSSISSTETSTTSSSSTSTTSSSTSSFATGGNGYATGTGGSISSTSTGYWSNSTTSTTSTSTSTTSWSTGTGSAGTSTGSTTTGPWSNTTSLYPGTTSTILPGLTSSASLTTSTVTTTRIYTVTSCAPGITCHPGAVTTEIITSLTTFCPATTLPTITSAPISKTTITTTSTKTYTITSCAPGITACHPGQVTTEIVTMTTTFCPQTSGTYAITKTWTCSAPGQGCLVGETVTKTVPLTVVPVETTGTPVAVPVYTTTAGEGVSTGVTATGVTTPAVETAVVAQQTTTAAAQWTTTAATHGGNSTATASSTFPVVTAGAAKMNLGHLLGAVLAGLVAVVAI